MTTGTLSTDDLAEPARPTIPNWSWIPPRHPITRCIHNSHFYKRFELLHRQSWENYPFEALQSSLASVMAIPLSDLFPAFDPNQSVDLLEVSELNRLHRDHQSAPTPAVLHFDEPLRLRSSTYYDFARIVCRVGDQPLSALITGEAAEDVEIFQWRAQPGLETNGIWLRQCKRVALRRCRIEEALHGVVVRSGNESVRIEDCQFFHNHRSAVFVQGANHDLVIVDNVIDKTAHSSNYAAAITLTATPILHEEIMEQDFQEHYYAPRPAGYKMRLNVPRRVLISRNEIVRGQSSGIYCDGPIEVIIDSNRVKKCDKEGVCLDSGSALCLVQQNRIEGNGARACQSDDALYHEFVMHEGRDATGASVVKLPGISMDNCLGIRVRLNTISHNWGGGIKMVRSAVFNMIAENRIVHNDPPAHPSWRWAGIMIDGAPSDDKSARDELDFFPGAANLITRNVIDRHEPGIHLTVGAAFNRIEHNEILRSKKAIDARHAPATTIHQNATDGRVIRYVWGWSPVRYYLRAIKEFTRAAITGRKMQRLK